MARGRDEAEWGRTSLLCATLVNSAPFRDGEPVPASAFNPYAVDRSQAAESSPAVVPLSSLRESFIREGWR